MFEKGRQKTGGRQLGSVNRLTGAFREAVLSVYDGLGGNAAFLEWARENQTEYYKIASRLIPTEMREGPKEELRVIVYGNPPSLTAAQQPPGRTLEDHSRKEP